MTSPLQGNPIAPWHMWGSSQSVQIPASAASGILGSTQLLRVNYKRPETWSFFFAARLSGAVVTAIPDDVTVEVAIDVIAGVGRSIFDTSGRLLAGWPRFVSFFWDLPAPTNFSQIAPKWTTVGSRVLLNDTDATDTIRPEWIVAEQLQASARVIVISPGGTSPAFQADITGFVAPRTHVRPDWFAEQNMFRGNETGGT